jgi:hypothetical protein
MSLFNKESEELIKKILRNGNSVEIKKENGKLVVVEIQRKVKTKTLITG